MVILECKDGSIFLPIGGYTPIKIRFSFLVKCCINPCIVTVIINSIFVVMK